jgi:hypothetical protein
MRRRATMAALAATLSTAGTALLASPAHAEDTWCDADPPVLITTPGGSVRIVYVVNAGPLLHAAQLLTPAITYRTYSTHGGTKTMVQLDVTVANWDGHGHAMRSEVWTGLARTGTLLSGESGTMGRTVRHQFTLDVA